MLLDNQMYVVTGVEFIFSIKLLISSVKIRKMNLLAAISLTVSELEWQIKLWTKHKYRSINIDTINKH